MDKLSSEQHQVERIRAARMAATAPVLDAAGPAAHRLTDGLLRAAESSATADLRYRRAERLEALGLDRTRTQAVRRSADRHNQVAIELLEQAAPTIEEIRREFGDRRIDATTALGVFAEEAREQIADADLSGEEAALGERLLAETLETANESGIAGVCDRLERDVSRLTELRRERPEHNNPIAFVVGGIAAGLGAVILGICWAVSGPGGCTNPTVLQISGGLIAFGLLIIVTGL
jgi:hypothetical protein